MKQYIFLSSAFVHRSPNSFLYFLLFSLFFLPSFPGGGDEKRGKMPRLPPTRQHFSLIVQSSECHYHSSLGNLWEPRAMQFRTDLLSSLREEILWCRVENLTGKNLIQIFWNGWQKLHLKQYILSEGMSEIQVKYWTTIACDSRRAGAPSLLSNIIKRILRQLQKNELRDR